MTNFSFGTFLVDDSNRLAFETAQAVADLRLPDAAPILFLGDSGCGKTHLMRAIVGRVRAATRHVGLAFITARHFPDAARLLIDDPSPVQRAAGAILLVDQLEEFTDLVDELEVVTRIFLDHGHAVAFASHLHPGRLQNLTPGLKDILASARAVSIEPQSSETRVELLKRQFREESGDVIRRQSLEIEELRREVDRLQRSGGGADGGQAQEQLELERAHSRELDRRIQGLEADLARFQADSDRMRAVEGQAYDAARLEEELDRSREEAGSLRTQVNSLANAVTELEALQERLTALEDERSRLREQAAHADELQREVRTLQDQLREAWAKSAHAADLEDTVAGLEREITGLREAAAERDTLREALEQSESEASRAREEANTLLGRAESLLELVESNRTRFREVESQRTAQIEELQAQLERERQQAVPMEDLLAVKRQAEDALTQLSTERENFEETQRSLEQACAEALSKCRELEAERDEALEARDGLQGELTSAREVRDAALRDLDEIRPVNTRLKEENSALRQELLDMSSRREETQQALYDMEAARDETLAEAEELRVRIGGIEQRLEALRAEHAGLQGLFSAKARELGTLAAALNSMAAEAPETQSDDGDSLPHPEIGGDPEVLPGSEAPSDEASAPEAIDFVAAEPAEHEIEDDMALDRTPESLEEAAPPVLETPIDEEPASTHAHGNGTGWHAEPVEEPDAAEDETPPAERMADSLEPLQDLTPLEDERDSSI